MERRNTSIAKPSLLPADYLKMLQEVFTANFDPAIKKMKELELGDFRFNASGGVYLDEIVLCVSLLQEGKLAATSVYASVDFDPKASAPTAQDLLSSCVDAVGTVYSQILDPSQPERLEQLADESLSALENAPFEWSEIPVDKTRVHVKMDKSNPELDQMTEDWLAKNDPDFHRKIEEEQKEAEKRFITGPSSSKKNSGNEPLH